MNNIQNLKTTKFESITTEMLETYKAKNSDYADSFGETFEKLGVISAVTRIADKTNRLLSLAGGNERKIDDERIEDTLLDLANYAVMTLIELDKGSEMGITTEQAVEQLNSANLKAPDAPKYSLPRPADVDHRFKWVARDANGDLYLFVSRPHKYEYLWNRDDSWSNEGYDNIKEISGDERFDSVRWDDEEPTYLVG